MEGGGEYGPTPTSGSQGGGPKPGSFYGWTQGWTGQVGPNPHRIFSTPESTLNRRSPGKGGDPRSLKKSMSETPTFPCIPVQNPPLQLDTTVLENLSKMPEFLVSSDIICDLFGGPEYPPPSSEPPGRWGRVRTCSRREERAPCHPLYVETLVVKVTERSAFKQKKLTSP